MKRTYSKVLEEHLKQHRQMAFVTGPRQVGKTTLCRGLVASPAYFNWDNQDHRLLILAGPERLAAEIGLDILRESRPVVVLDEIHKYPRWKTFLKSLSKGRRKPTEPRYPRQPTTTGHEGCRLKTPSLLHVATGHKIQYYLSQNETDQEGDRLITEHSVNFCGGNTPGEENRKIFLGRDFL